MAKLTVFFKYKAIDSHFFEKGVIHIGRDETNDLTIDSLAVAPAHAAIMTRDGMNTIKQLNENFPLVVNGQKVKEHYLNNNDMITLGKHDVLFNTTESVAETGQDNGPSSVFRETAQYTVEHGDTGVDSGVEHNGHLMAASLQVLSGKNIGKVLALKKAMTRLGSVGSGVIVISRRKEGYFASALENGGLIKINNTPIDDHYFQLNNNDILMINDVSLQFFLD